MSWCRVHTWKSDIRKATLGQNVWCYHWEGCMGNMQCNVKFGYQLIICSGTKENHRKPWLSWLVAGPSGCKPTPSQQSGIKSTSPNISPYLCCFLSFFPPFFLFLFFLTSCFLQLFLCAYNLDKHQTVYNTCERNEHMYEEICIQIYIYLYLWSFHYR
jgi:hypothetical protein